MSFTFQLVDPDDMRVTIQMPGKYNPDILEDGKRRLIDAYREAWQTRVDILGAELAHKDDEPSE